MMKYTIRLFRVVAGLLLGGEFVGRWLGVTIGRGCRIYITEFGSEPWLITIGDRVTIAAGTKLLTHDGATWLVADEQGRRYQYRPINIGNDVFVGLNAVILPGVVVADKVIIGAGSVVTKSVPSGSIVAGNPARIVGKYSRFKERALGSFPTNGQMKGETYRERITSIVEWSPREWLVDAERCQ